MANANNPVSGYEGFEDPDEYDYGPSVPQNYPMGLQVRQFGVGGTSTSGVYPTVLSALANPPAKMVTAANKVLTTNLYTNNDLGRYFPAAEYFAPTQT